MRALREKMKEAKKQDNRGLSLVEVLCAVAIFSLIVAGVSTVIVMSSKTFRRGVTETSLQQEAQLVANRIGTIVQDACEVSFDADRETLILKTNEMVDDGAGGKENKTYKIVKNGTNLLYSEEGTISDAKLAEKIQDFKVTTTDFEKSNTVHLELKMVEGGKMYTVQYAIAARNEMTADLGEYEHSEDVGILCDTEVVMVPGETLQIPISVVAKNPMTMEAKITDSGLNSDDVEVSAATDSVTVKLSPNIDITHTQLNLYIATQEKKDGTMEPMADANVMIRIRRVTKVSVTHVSDRSGVDPSKAGNSYEAQGCVYTFYANVLADNAEKRAGTYYDKEWKSPRAVYWTATIDGASGMVTDYFDIEYGEDKNVPTAKFTIKDDLPSGLRLTVLATSKHAKGENKASSYYYKDSNNPSSNYASVSNTEKSKSSEQWGYDSFEARPAKINPPDEISLDPTETGSVKLIMKGGKLTDIECIPRGNTDSSTQAYFNPSDNCVYVKIGKDERGSGITPSDPMKKFTFTVDVCDKNTGDKKATITVHVKRVDKISLDKVDNKDGSYTFTTKFNVDRREASLEDVENNSLYLINNKYNPRNPDGSLQNRTPFTLGVVYTFQVQDDGKKIDLGYIISRATCATEPNADKNIWNGTFDPKNDYITWEDYPYPASHSAAVTGEDTDDSHLTELPTLKIKKGSKSFEKITITAIAFHALGAEKGKEYMPGPNGAEGIFQGRASYGVIQDEQVIYGDQKIKIPADFVVVEPGQGFDGYTKSNDDGIDNELVVPIKIVGDYVDTMTAEIIGNLSTGTRLSKCYVEKEGKQEFNNPYWSRTDVGVNTADTWWLGLVIGADEKSKDMKVVIYGSDNKELLRFDLRLRRVEQVELTVDDQRSISEWNKAEEKVTLKAYVSGENFDEQKVNGETCRWETSGHGQYKSPGTIKWTMEYKYEEKTLDKWTEYFQLEGEPNIEKVIDNKKYSNSITFTLKKALPNGAIIRATSLHAKGDETEGTTTKYYNKAGKEYDKKFAEIKIGTSYVDVNFRRGTDNSLGNYFANNSKYRQDHTQRNFFRYREVGGAWSTYHIMDDRSETTVKFDGDKSSLLFLAEKEYQIEVINVVFDADQKKIYWPHDESLLEPGKGWKEEGYTKGWIENDVTPEDEYMAKLYIPKTQVFFGENKDWNVSDHSITFGIYGRNNPIPLSTGKSIKVDLQTDHFHLGNKQSYYKAKVQKLENGSWVDSSPYEWYLQTDCPNYQIYNITNNAKGTYRIGVVIQDMPWNKIGGSLMEPTFTQFNHSTELYDWTTDRGVIYLQFNE